MQGGYAFIAGGQQERLTRPAKPVPRDSYDTGMVQEQPTRPVVLQPDQPGFQPARHPLRLTFGARQAQGDPRLGFRKAAP